MIRKFKKSHKSGLFQRYLSRVLGKGWRRFRCSVVHCQEFESTGPTTIQSPSANSAAPNRRMSPQIAGSFAFCCGQRPSWRLSAQTGPQSLKSPVTSHTSRDKHGSQPQADWVWKSTPCCCQSAGMPRRSNSTRPPFPAAGTAHRQENDYRSRLPKFEPVSTGLVA